MDLIATLIVAIFIIAVAYYLGKEVVTHLPLPPQLAQLIIALLALLLLLWFIGRFMGVNISLP